MKYQILFIFNTLIHLISKWVKITKITPKSPTTPKDLTKRNDSTPSIFSSYFRLLLIGQYGLKNKREVWRVQYILTRIRKAARELLTLDEDDPRRIFEGDALIRRMRRIGVLKKEESKLDYVLGLTTKQFLDRRLQTIVNAKKDAKSIHQARTLIFAKKIAINQGLRRQVINIPSYIVRTENETKIMKIADKEGPTRTKKRLQRKRDEKKKKC